MKSEKKKFSLREFVDREGIAAMLYLLPAMAIIGIFTFYPTLQLILTSLYKWDGMSEKKFVLFKNYIKLFKDEEFFQTVINSFVFILGTVPLGLAVSLCLALLIQKYVLGRGIFRTIFFSPVVTSLVAAGLIWVWLLNYDYGVLNVLLQKVGFPKIPWLVSDKYAMMSVIIMSIWKDAGYNMIIFLAGLNNVSETYYEAARIDGANKFQIFKNITWPLLMPTTIFLLIIRMIFSFRTFEQVYAMTRGGPTGSTTVFVYYIYEKAFKLFEVGYASAAAVILLVIVMILTFIQFKVVKNENE